MDASTLNAVLAIIAAIGVAIAGFTLPQTVGQLRELNQRLDILTVELKRTVADAARLEVRVDVLENENKTTPTPNG